MLSAGAPGPPKRFKGVFPLENSPRYVGALFDTSVHEREARMARPTLGEAHFYCINKANHRSKG